MKAYLIASGSVIEVVLVDLDKIYCTREFDTIEKAEAFVEAINGR